MSSLGSPDEPFSIVGASEWGEEEIKAWLKITTKDNKNRELQELWHEFFLPHFEQQKTLRFGADGRTLEPKIISLNGVPFRIYSSWCALAAVLNLELPRYDPGVGSAAGYACSILILLAKWSNSIKASLPKGFCPIVYSVSFAVVEQSPDTSKGLVVIISTGRCINLGDCEEFNRLSDEWGNGKIEQLVEMFDATDNPLDRGSRWFGGTLKAPVGTKLTQAFKHRSRWARGLVSCETLRLYHKRQSLKGGGVSVKQTIGICAEAWGFMMMGKKVKPGHRFTTISVTGALATKAKLSEGYNFTPLKSKPACINCVYLSCAFEARYKITMDVFDGEVTADSRPVEPPDASEDPATPSDASESPTTPSDVTGSPAALEDATGGPAALEDATESQIALEDATGSPAALEGAGETPVASQDANESPGGPSAGQEGEVSEDTPPSPQPKRPAGPSVEPQRGQKRHRGQSEEAHLPETEAKK